MDGDIAPLRLEPSTLLKRSWRLSEFDGVHASMASSLANTTPPEDTRWSLGKLSRGDIDMSEASVARVGEICDLAEKYEAQVFVDECHATGFLGAIDLPRFASGFNFI